MTRIDYFVQACLTRQTLDPKRAFNLQGRNTPRSKRELSTLPCVAYVQRQNIR